MIRRSARIARVALVVLVVLHGVAATQALAQAAAQPAAQAQPPAGGSGDFVPVKELPPQETIPAAPLVMAAYGFVWAALLAYVWTVWRRLLKVEGEIKDLSARLAGKSGKL
jgi:CcmD family protein